MWHLPANYLTAPFVLLTANLITAIEATAADHALPKKAIAASHLEACKKRAARQAVDFALKQAPEARVIGIGSGSTVRYVIEYLGELTRQGRLKGERAYVPTSVETERLLREAGLPITRLQGYEKIAIAIDGADAIDPWLNCIKGGGGAHWQEKKVASRATCFVLVADYTKLCAALDKQQRHGIPLEVVAHKQQEVISAIRALGGRGWLRIDAAGEPVVTDSGNRIVDAHFEAFEPFKLNGILESLPGVCATGLFLQMADHAFIGMRDGTIYVIHATKPT